MTAADWFAAGFIVGCFLMLAVAFGTWLIVSLRNASVADKDNAMEI